MKILSIIKKYLPYGLLILLILFNFYLYRGEFDILSDPNDNNFHYALIDESKTIWKSIFSGKTSVFSLLDSWNERWAEGFPLSSYYSHLPQAVFSLFSFVVPVTTFKLFVIFRTLLLILLPVTFFIGVRIIGFSRPASIIVAFFSQSIFTDGLYGLDATSYLWRGWGLTAQLLATFFLPLAFSYSLDYLENKKNLGKAILFNFIVAQSHFGMFYLLLIAYPVYWIFSKERWIEVGKRTGILLTLIMISLAYFIVPFFTTSVYRNFSLWDPIWKFNSLGITHILKLFINGEMFDFNRLPFITFSVIFGLLWSLKSKNKLMKFFGVIFIIYFILYLGRDVLGPLTNIIPGLSEYHLHRVIIMVQFVGLLMAGNGISDLIQRGKYSLDSRLRGNDSKDRHYVKRANGSVFVIPVKTGIQSIITLIVLIICFLSIYLIEKPIIKYVKDNDIWIARSNIIYQKNINDYQSVINRLRKLPSARIYAGRPGNWGKDFKIGDTQIYMALSRDGFPTLGFLPQSWSPNSDAEQFFDEENQKHYDLYNVGYVVLPVDKKPPKFAKLIAKKGKFSLYKVNSEGWFTLGRSSLEVATKKNNLVNIVHLWFYSPMFLNKDYPVISLNKENHRFVDRVIKMKDQNNYNESKSLWKENPLLVGQEKFEPTIINKVEKKLTQGYEVSFRLKNKCENCVLILKQTFHPNWKITVNGKKQNTFPIFPFFIGIQLNEPGDYKIIATYQQSILKYILLFLSIIFFTFCYTKLSK